MRVPAETTCVLLRHSSVDNPGNIYYGTEIDLPLSDAGREQARKLGASLQSHIGYPLRRTRETALLVASVYPSIPVYYDKRLNDTRSRHLGGVAHDWCQKLPDIYDGGGVWGYWIEPKASIATRITDSVGDWAKQYPGQQLFFVSSGHPILFFQWKLNHPHEEFPASSSIRGRLRNGEGIIFRSDELGVLQENFFSPPG